MLTVIHILMSIIREDCFGVCCYSLHYCELGEAMTCITLQAERDAIECELKSANADMKDEFLNALSQDGTINEVAISTESLGRLFGPLQKQVCYIAFQV